MAAILRPLLCALLLTGSVHLVDAFADKCAACQAVAAELEMGLLNERPRNHLDMRHRLDSTGHREGKLIDYKASELRVVELLDGLCSRMKAYTLEMAGPEKGKWTKSAISDSIQDRREADAHSKQITTYCGRLLEGTEEELEERIKNGSIKLGEVEKTLCWELAQECRNTSRKEVETGTINDGEL